jgi:MAternally-affected-uncoordination protein
MQELVKELSALDQSLSRCDLHYRERAALSEKQAIIQGQLRNMNGFSSIGRESLEPVYFGNSRRTLGDKLQLAPPPIDGEWLPKSAVYALVDLIVVVFGRPKGLFKECGKRIQSGMRIVQGCSATVFALFICIFYFFWLWIDLLLAVYIIRDCNFKC